MKSESIYNKMYNNYINRHVYKWLDLYILK